MKKTLTAVLTALVLVSCHQPTKEEQLDKEIRTKVVEYIESNSAYPEDIEITSVKIDTLTSNHATASFISSLKDNEYCSIILETFDKKLSRDYEKLKSVDWLQDTTIPDVYYCVATVKARHMNDDKKPVVDTYAVPIWGDEIKEANDISNIVNDDVNKFRNFVYPDEINIAMTIAEIIQEFIYYFR